MNPKRILVATDFSTAGDRALQQAVIWARRYSAALRIVHVVPPKRWLGGLWGADSATTAVVHRGAAAALRQRADRIDARAQLEVSTALLSGRAAKAIARAARDFDANLIVIGAHGARGDHGEAAVPLGGTASSLVANTTAPLLIVRRAPTEAANVVVAAVDLTPISNTVLEWSSVAAIGGELHVLHAYEVAFAERLETYNLAAQTIDVYTAEEHARRERQLAELVGAVLPCNSKRAIARGDAVKVLIEYIRRVDATLLVLGQHARHKGRRNTTTYGSVCRYLTSLAPSDVLVVPA